MTAGAVSTASAEGPQAPAPLSGTNGPQVQREAEEGCVACQGVIKGCRGQCDRLVRRHSATSYTSFLPHKHSFTQTEKPSAGKCSIIMKKDNLA